MPVKRETVTVYTVAGEQHEKKAAATARADELNAELEDRYRATVADLEDQAARAARILGRDVADVHLAFPPPPAAATVEKLELVRAFEVHELEPRTGPAGEELEPARIVARPLGLDRDAAAGELDALQGDRDGWRGPRRRYELVERLIPPPAADALEQETSA